jgi:hypothetical protein
MQLIVPKCEARHILAVIDADDAAEQASGCSEERAEEEGTGQESISDYSLYVPCSMQYVSSYCISEEPKKQRYIIISAAICDNFSLC